MTPKERAVVEALLAHERERAAAIEASLAAEHQAIVEASAQANLDDEHDPEGATVGFERARVASLLSEARRRSSDIDQAVGAAGRRHLRQLRALRTADRARTTHRLPDGGDVRQLRVSSGPLATAASVKSDRSHVGARPITLRP